MESRQTRIVTIGGGTGHFTLLTGLKKYFTNISAVVSMADDGGSTGRLRDELGVLPPGDVRQCLVALSNTPKLLRDLMVYRFEKGDLKGHNFGNIFLSALEKITGDFEKGLEEATRILNVKNKVIPVSKDKMSLHVRLRNGRLLVGEKQLDQNKAVKKIGIKKVFLRPKARLNERVKQAVKKAHFIVIGPGDLYGSILPNLLVDGLAQAIKDSRARIIYVCNLSNKKGQTDNFDLDDYAEFVNKYLQDRLDYVIYNVSRPALALVKKYEKLEGKNSMVQFHPDKNPERSYKVIKANILKRSPARQNKNDAIAKTRSFIRHDGDKLAKVLVELSELNRKKIIKEII